MSTQRNDANDATARAAGSRPEGSAPPRIGPFDILTKLGTGGSATVYKAVDRRTGRVVALKVPASTDPDAVERFRRAARLGAQVQHPNVAQVGELLGDGPFCCLALEFVPGVSLAARAAARPLPETDALALIRQIADGLAACHARGIVHGDVKPSHIRIDDSGTAKLLDLGLARETGAADARSDIYSLGVTLCYALTGKPAAGRGPLELDDGVRALLGRMTAASPADRPQTMRAVIAEIDRLQRAGASSAAATAPPMTA